MISEQVLENPKDFQESEGLFIKKSVTTSHLFNLQSPEILDDYIECNKFVKSSPLVQSLLKKGISIDSLVSLLRCGKKTGGAVRSSCRCSEIDVPVTYHCSNRSCPRCSKVRSRRLFRKYYPLLSNLVPSGPFNLRYLTISPANYDNLAEGMTHIRKSLSKFFRLKYVRERVKGGMYVIETKTKNKFGESKGWNIHIHLIYYGRKMSNELYGFCSDCGMTRRLKYDKTSERFYCSARVCSSVNVEHNGEDSKLVRMFEAVSGRKVNMDIRTIDPRNKRDFVSSSHMLSYTLKYISANKDDFSTLDDFAEYVVYTKGRRLVSTFGFFYSAKIPSFPSVCMYCDTEISYRYIPDCSFDSFKTGVP